MTTTRPRRFTRPAEEAAEAHKDKWVVTWWQTRAGVLELASSDHEHPGTARIEYTNKDSGSDPGIWHWSYDTERDRWNVISAIESEMAPIDQANLNRKGAAVVRGILRHRSGSDSRGMATRSLDATLADDNPATPRPSKVTDPEPLTTEDPATCVVCDYLCEHGMAPHHPHTPAAAIQERF